MRFANWFLFLSSSLLLIGGGGIVHAEFVNTPSVRWSYQLPGLGTLRKGNAVVSTTFEDTVFCTTDDGSLHIINPNDLDESVVVEAPSIRGADTECNSGVAIRESSDGVFEYAVYAVTFTPNNNAQGTPIISRVIAVNQTGSELWSQEVNGVVEGTPLIGVGGTSVYISHNLENGGGGRVTVLLVANDAVALAAEIEIEGSNDRFGPLTSQAILMEDGDPRDVVFWGETNLETDLGLTYALLPSDVYDDGVVPGAGRESYTLLTVAQWRRSLVTRPIVRLDLTGLFLAGSGGIVAGWTLDSSPINQIDGSGPARFTWRTNLDPDANDLGPLPTSMILSSDGESLYLTDLSNNAVCLDADSGDVIWRSDGAGRSGYVAQPRLSEMEGETPVVYVIEEDTGNIRQHDATSGNINWQYDCNDRGSDNDCKEAVEAEFHVGASGNLLFFGDVLGTISAVEVGTFPFVTPTVAPTVSTPAPSIATEFPTFAATTESPAIVAETPGPTLAPVLPQETEEPSSIETTSAPIPVVVVPEPTAAPEPTTAGTEPTAAPGPTAAPVPEPKPTASPISTFPDNSFNAAAPTGSNNNDNNKILLIAMITLFMVAAIAAMGFFVLMVRRKKKTKESQEDLKKKRQAEAIWQDQQKQLEEDCRQQEMEMMQELGGEKNPADQPSTPKKSLGAKKKSSPPPLVGTPTTLASIEEVANEDMSVATEATSENRPVKDVESGYALNHAISNLTSLTYFGAPPIASAGDVGIEDEKKEDEKASGLESYLPQALVSTFDTVVNLGRSDTASKSDGQQDQQPQSDRSNSPPREISTHLSEKQAYQRYFVPGSDVADPALGGGLGMYSLNSFDSGDGSSIGSESLFMDEDSKSAIQTLASDASQPGIIASKANKVVEEEEETGTGAWTNLMSTLIQAEKQFFNPNSTSPERKRVTPPPAPVPPEQLSPLDDLSIGDGILEDLKPNTGYDIPSFETTPSSKPTLRAIPFDEPDEEVPFDMVKPAPARAMSPPNSSVGSSL